MFKKIAITGKNGLLGSYFYRKYKDKFKIISYPGRIENLIQFKKWIEKNNFDIFIHFAAITNSKNKKKKKKIMDLVNKKASINMIKILNKSKNNYLKYFLFISTSHVYGYSNNAIKENKARKPNNYYGKTKKIVEDFIINNRKNIKFNLGIARVFNYTYKTQKKGYFVPDVVKKIKRRDKIYNTNCYRDYIHINDICKSLMLLVKKYYEKPVNICSGSKINLNQIINILEKKMKIKALTNKNRAGDIFGNNKRLKLLGIKKFNTINHILSNKK